MKQLVILSGKGGTGKTSVASAFAHLSSDPAYGIRALFVDADVDAANLGLVLKPQTVQTQEFWGGAMAEIDTPLCTGCGACVSVCRYDAIFPDPAHLPAYWIDPVACDGCAACVYACPEGAISMVPQQDGYWFHSTTPYGDLFHAELFAGKENSGKLVTLVRQFGRLQARDTDADLVIIDGPPGIGCPVISACSGADLGLIVTEPGQAGFHDMKRILATLQHFRIPAVLCINKADLYQASTDEIIAFAQDQGIEVLGLIPYDEAVPSAMLQGQPVTDAYPGAPASAVIRQSWQAVLNRLLAPKEG